MQFLTKFPSGESYNQSHQGQCSHMLSLWLQAAQCCRERREASLGANAVEDAEGLSVNYACTVAGLGGTFTWPPQGRTCGVTQPKSPESALLQAWLYLGVQMTTPQSFFTSWSCFLSMSSIFQQVLSMWWSSHHERLQAHLFSVSTPARKNLPVSFLSKSPRNNSPDWL